MCKSISFLLFFQVFAQQENIPNEFEHLYSKVDRAAILREAEAEDQISSNKPTYLDEISYDSRQEYRGSGTFETPPPVPTRTIHDDDDDEPEPGEKDHGYSTIRSTTRDNHDEGYSTVEETLQREKKKANKVRRQAYLYMYMYKHARTVLPFD